MTPPQRNTGISLATVALVLLMVVMGNAQTQNRTQIQTPAAPQTWDPLNSGWRFGLGLGYLHSGGGITSIWGNGISLDMTIGYRPWKALGFDLVALYAYTSITDAMKNKIGVVSKGGDLHGTRESGGGNNYELLLGPLFYFNFPGSGLVLTAGAGGRWGGTAEEGMSDVEDYSSRWTYGWGWYIGGGLGLSTPMGLGALVYELHVRYLIGKIKVNDFYYDRVYNTTSYDAIPATYEWDRLLQISFGVTLEFM
jgi:hypothetical protein